MIPQHPEQTTISFIGTAQPYLDDTAIPRLPSFLMPVQAGFPSPAEDYRGQDMNLHEHLVQNPAATFFARASSDSMINAGIHDGDLLVIDRSIPPENGHRGGGRRTDGETAYWEGARRNHAP
jgi:DNA polymerase V